MDSISEFAIRVFMLAKIHDGSVTSWIRSKDYNREVGGVEKSRHLEGMAVDMVFASHRDKSECADAALRAGLFCLDEGDHLHIGAPK